MVKLFHVVFLPAAYVGMWARGIQKRGHLLGVAVLHASSVPRETHLITRCISSGHCVASSGGSAPLTPSSLSRRRSSGGTPARVGVGWDRAAPSPRQWRRHVRAPGAGRGRARAGAARRLRCSHSPVSSSLTSRSSSTSTLRTRATAAFSSSLAASSWSIRASAAAQDLSNSSAQRRTESEPKHAT